MIDTVGSFSILPGCNNLFPSPFTTSISNFKVAGVVRLK